MKRDVCAQVFGKRWSELNDEERKRALRYRRQANHYRHFQQDTKRMRDAAQNKKRQVLEALGWAAACSRCGYDRYIGALDFHHLDPSQKNHCVLKMGLDRAIIEARKCQLICSNCHRELHADDTPKSTGRPRVADPLLERYLRASGLTEEQITCAMVGR